MGLVYRRDIEREKGIGDKMRESRGKRKDNGEWAVGCVRTCFTESSGYKEKGPYISWFVGDELHEAEVIPETVGQFTGLCDKDGKEIYEGDVVQWDDASNGEYWRIGEVIFDHGRYGFQILPSSPTCHHKDIFWFDRFIYCPDTSKYGNVLEVIGSIHTHPELLK